MSGGSASAAPAAPAERTEGPAPAPQFSAARLGRRKSGGSGGPGPSVASEMLPGKAEKRMASSIFITLVPPRRDVGTEEKTHREPQPDGAQGPVTHRPRIPLSPPALPNGETPPAVPVPSSPPLLILSEAPQPTSAESLGSALQQLDLTAPATLQAPSSFPAELKPPKLCQEQEDKPQWQDVNGYPERDSSRDICAFCHKALGRREPTVEAMGKQYHPGCFTCRTCQRRLAGQRYFQRDGRPMCDTCYQATLEKCAKCQGLITEHIIRALGKAFHPGCFSCAGCGRAIGAESFAVDEQGDVYCVPDFYRKYAAVCGACERPIVPSEDKDTYKIECLGRSFHESCYCCESCRTPLSPELTEDGCYPLDSHLLCKSCHVRWRNESSC